MQNNHNTDKKSAAELLEEFEKKYNYRGSKEVNLTKMQNSDTGMQEQVTEEHIEPALECRDQEREKILLLTKKCLTDPKYKEFESYIKQTAEQHILLHHEAYLKEADGGKQLHANDNGVSAKTFKSCVVSGSYSNTKAPEVSR